MKIFDAVYTAAVLLGLDELCDGMTNPKFNASNPRTVLGEDDAKELELLLRCCNLVLTEVSESGFPLKAVCSVSVGDDGKIPYSALPKTPSEIIAVRKGGDTLPHRTYYDCVTVRVSGKCEVEYAFAHPKAALSDVSSYESGRPSARLIAYGIAREYCLISGMTDEAAAWDSRYLSCFDDETREKKEKKVRARVWL